MWSDRTSFTNAGGRSINSATEQLSRTGLGDSVPAAFGFPPPRCTLQRWVQMSNGDAHHSPAYYRKQKQLKKPIMEELINKLWLVHMMK